MCTATREIQTEMIHTEMIHTQKNQTEMREFVSALKKFLKDGVVGLHRRPSGGQIGTFKVKYANFGDVSCFQISL